MNGPFPAGHNDGQIFSQKGLMDKIPTGKKAITDHGYKGSYEGKVSKSSSRDSEGIEKHKICFEACCVIVQYQLEAGDGLFDV